MVADRTRYAPARPAGGVGPVHIAQQTPEKPTAIARITESWHLFDVLHQFKRRYSKHPRPLYITKVCDQCEYLQWEDARGGAENLEEGRQRCGHVGSCGARYGFLSRQIFIPPI